MTGAARAVPRVMSHSKELFVTLTYFLSFEMCHYSKYTELLCTPILNAIISGIL